MITVGMDIQFVKKSLAKMGRDIGISATDVMYDQMRLLLNDMIKYTAPKSAPEGRKAVGNDISKLFTPIDQPEIILDYAKSLSEGDDVVYFPGKRRAAKIRKRQLAAKSMDHLRNIHESKRSKKTGRVYFKPDSSLAYGGKTLVPRDILMKYVRLRQKSVGQLKAGWIPALDIFAGLSHGRKRVPAWIAKQANKLGKHSVNINKSGKGYVEAENMAPGAKYNSSIKRWTKTLIRKREHDMKGGIEKRIDRIIEQFNKDSI